VLPNDASVLDTKACRFIAESIMDQEHQLAYQQNQTMLGCGLMGIFLFAGLMFAFYSGDLLVWLTVPLILGAVGLVTGLLIARLGAKLGVGDDRSRGPSGQRQIVNEECILCQQRIASIMDGILCSGCGAAFHQHCAQTVEASGVRCCPRCKQRSRDIIQIHT
jgi:hypothetical protein